MKSKSKRDKSRNLLVGLNSGVVEKLRENSIYIRGAGNGKKDEDTSPECGPCGKLIMVLLNYLKRKLKFWLEKRAKMMRFSESALMVLN